MVRSTDPNGSGKGDDYRKVDQIRWKEFWERYCKHYGHKPNQNGICIFCGEIVKENKKP